MIRKFERNVGQTYFNIFERFLIACVDEFYNITTKFRIYDEDENKYNIRKIFWVFFFLFLAIVTALPIYTATILYIINQLH